jgi:hypothetical protein
MARSGGVRLDHHVEVEDRVVDAQPGVTRARGGHVRMANDSGFHFFGVEKPIATREGVGCRREGCLVMVHE